jgi:archaellum component FlaF (FlaF/FlaG flagellin family)
MIFSSHSKKIITISTILVLFISLGGLFYSNFFNFNSQVASASESILSKIFYTNKNQTASPTTKDVSSILAQESLLRKQMEFKIKMIEVQNNLEIIEKKRQLEELQRLYELELLKIQSIEDSSLHEINKNLSNIVTIPKLSQQDFLPIGYQDNVNSNNQVTGWYCIPAYQNRNFISFIYVETDINGKKVDAFAGYTKSNIARPDVNQNTVCKNGNHGFSFTIGKTVDYLGNVVPTPKGAKVKVIVPMQNASSLTLPMYDKGNHLTSIS